MAYLLTRCHHAVGRLGTAEYGIDRAEDCRRGAERHLERDTPPLTLRRCDLRCEVLAHRLEGGRIGALETEDRLLGIADREDRANDLPGTFAREELLGQRGYDPPLIGVGILRLVDKDVVEALVELVEDPGGTAPGEELLRAQNEIIVIEKALLALVALIGREHRRTQTEQSSTGLRRDRRLEPLDHGREPCRLRAQRRLGSRARPAHSLGRKRAARRAVLGEKLRRIGGEVLGALRRRRSEPGRDRGPALAVRGGALGKCGRCRKKC